LTDDDDRCRRAGVFLGERASLHQRNPHRLEVLLADQDVAGLVIAGGDKGSTLDGKRLAARTVNRRTRGDRCSDDAGIMADHIECLAPKGNRFRKRSAAVGSCFQEVFNVDSR
jgi:hypothetical protein